MKIDIKKHNKGYIVAVTDDEGGCWTQTYKPFVDGYQPIETEEEAQIIAEQLIRHLQEAKNYTPPPNPWEYAEKRRQEYPPIGDQLDAIWKLLEPTGEAYEMKQKILAVKAKYPKPSV